MKNSKHEIRPHDIVVLIRIIMNENVDWNQMMLANQLYLSQSEINKSLNRSYYSGLYEKNEKYVYRYKLIDFLIFGLPFVFPQKPGEITKGMPTSHSARPLNTKIVSDEMYVWPYYKGSSKGQAIAPLYPGIIEASKLDSDFYEIISLVDALRVGKAREKEIAIQILKERIG